MRSVTITTKYSLFNILRFPIVSVNYAEVRFYFYVYLL